LSYEKPEKKMCDILESILLFLTNFHGYAVNFTTLNPWGILLICGLKAYTVTR